MLVVPIPVPILSRTRIGRRDDILGVAQNAGSGHGI